MVLWCYRISWGCTIVVCVCMCACVLCCVVRTDSSLTEQTHTFYSTPLPLSIFYHVPNFSSRTYFTHAIILSKSVCVCARYGIRCVQCHINVYTTHIRATVTADANAKTKTVILKLNPWHFCRILCAEWCLQFRFQKVLGVNDHAHKMPNELWW